ncbi:MAG: long-chain fatty acid--CoA ligase [Propionicimonas sp.]
MDPNNIAVRFAAAALTHGQRPATRIRVGDAWVVQTYDELSARVRRLAARLIDAGLQPGDRVGVFAPNLPEWTLVDLACLTAGLVVVPLYPTSTAEQAEHILADSGCRLLFVDNAERWQRIADADLPALERAVAFTPVEGLVTLADELAAAPADESAVEGRLTSTSGDDLATIVYTSGTTGVPKGVMLNHRGFVHQLEVLTRSLQISPEDSSLCFLPLSHALERAWTFVLLCCGAQNTYVPDPKTVADQLVLAQPTLLVSVPRLYEKVYATAKERVAGSAVKRRIMAWALKVGAGYHRALLAGRTPSALAGAKYRLADKLVLSNVRTAMGGPKSVLACGGAPLRQEIEEFFLACGLLVLQGYGLTEASPLVSFPSPRAYRFGTVGQVIEGAEVKLTDEGEICYRAPNLMVGYWGQPEATAEVLRDGWLHTGDIGEVDADGYLKITDRIKDLIVTSNGKNIAPAPIEGLLAVDPLLEYTAVLGDNRPYLTLLVSPSLPHLEDIGHQLQLTWEHRDELLHHPAILDEIKRRVDALTERLAAHEKIRDMRVLIEEFSQENGLLTPTLKVKRREVEQRFAALVDEMYAKAGRPRH